MDNTEGIHFVCTDYAKKYCESRSKLCTGINGGTIDGWYNYYHKCQKNGHINGFVCSCKPNHVFLFCWNILFLVLFVFSVIPISIGSLVYACNIMELSNIHTCIVYALVSSHIITFLGLIMIVNTISMKELVNNTYYILMLSSLVAIVIKIILSIPVYISLKKIRKENTSINV